MKKIGLIILITIFTKNIHGQDTLAYLQSIVANKAQYIGQPFSTLYSNLSIQIKFFSPVADIHHNKSKETATRFSFFFPQSADDMYLTYPLLRISWQPFLNATQSDVIWESNNGGEWNTSAYNFYKNAIIADIKVRDK